MVAAVVNNIVDKDVGDSTAVASRRDHHDSFPQRLAARRSMLLSVAGLCAFEVVFVAVYVVVFELVRLASGGIDHLLLDTLLS